MGKVLVLGIDALDAALMDRFEEHLPNMRRLRQRDQKLRLTSVYPPDTPTAWASAYTGLNPARHGIIYFIDPLDKVSILASMDLNSDPVRGKTFWDVASSQGKRVCVLFPFLGYPVWPVNGIMVGRSTNKYNKGPLVQAYPSSVAEQNELAALGPIFSLPQKKYFPSYIEAYRRLVKAETEFGLKMWKAENWDVFFQYSSALDWVGHNLWSYFDETDSAYPGETPYKSVLLEFYKLYDEMVGRFLAAAGSGTTVIVFSDHGFTQRPSKLFNVNELLRREGLLVPKAKHRGRGVFNPLEMAKKMAIGIVNRYGAGAWTMWLVHHLPALRRQFTIPRTIDWERTTAYVSDLSGIKAYSYGGIIFSAEKLGKSDYEKSVARIVERLKEFKHAEDGEPVLRWVSRREELYNGPFLHKYPEIIFQLWDDYGVGWDVFQPMVTLSASHNIQPGTHKADSAALLVAGDRSARVSFTDVTLMDIAPTILDILDLKPTFEMDGKSFLAP